MSFEECIKRWLGVYREINGVENSIISAEAVTRINTNKNTVQDRKEKFFKIPHKTKYMVVTHFGMNRHDWK